MSIPKINTPSLLVSLIIILMLTPIVWVLLSEVNKDRLDKFVDNSCLKSPLFIVLNKLDVTKGEYLAIPKERNGDLLLSDNAREKIYLSTEKAVLIERLSAKVVLTKVFVNDSVNNKKLGYLKFYSRHGGGTPFTETGTSSYLCKTMKSNFRRGYDQVLNIL